ncbi:MAG: tryptophan 7-halogenase [Solirubrobacterales bacterium]|nr:tryptophan 7-halogenase [Solirubrobacterales bacterium]
MVVGGGPAGTAAAATARAEGLSVELLCARRGHRPAPGESLPPGTEGLLHEIFGASMLDDHQHQASFGNSGAWGGPDVEATEFVRNPFGHGWHIDRAALEASLHDRLRTLGVRVRSDVRVTGQAWSADGWRIALDDRDTTVIRAGAIVDATGRAARIARSQGARRRRLDRLVAAYWMLAAGDAQDGECTTLVQAAREGWWYTTPLPGGRRVVAFLTDADLMPARATRIARDWHERLEQAPHIEDRLASSGCALHSDPVILDAAVAHLDHPAGHGWVAAGDAAVSFDPLSSQGMLTSFVMGSGAGHAVAAMLTRGDQQPLIRWGAEYARLLEAHLRLQAAYYALECRWPTAPFWARRRNRGASPDATSP